MAGFDVATERNAVRRHIGLVFQEPTLDAYLTGEQNEAEHCDRIMIMNEGRIVALDTPDRLKVRRSTCATRPGPRSSSGSAS